MQIAPFLLDEWLSRNFNASPPIEYDLGSSTGPVWTLRELLALEHGDQQQPLLDMALSYTSPEGTASLREEIGRMQGVDPDHIQIVTGGAEALLMLFYMAAEPGANVVLPEPGFPTNAALAQSLGIEIRRYHLRAASAFRPDPDELRRAVDRNTRFVLVNSPHNPTGAVFTESEMESLHDFCVERGVALVSDEVYHPIYHGSESPSAARLPHATVISDFSKALCLSGLRTGWIVERDPARRHQFTRMRSYFTVSNTALGEHLAALAIRHRDAIFGRARRIAAANLALLDEFFAARRDVFGWVRPAGGMTAFPWLVDGRDARPFCVAAARQGVLLAPGDCFGMPSHFRVGFAAVGERFPAALQRWASIVCQL